MGKDLKGKELGVGISQRPDGFYVGRFTTKHGQRKQKYMFSCAGRKRRLKTAHMILCCLNSVTR